MAVLLSDIQAADADGRIPDGIPLSYLAESRDQPAIAGILFMVCFTGLIVIARFYARALVVKKVGIDDSLALVTLASYIAFVALSIVLINLGSGRHIEYIQYVLSMSTVHKTEVLDFVAHILYTTALLLCRLSGLAFYSRIAARFSTLHRSILVAAPVLIAAYLPQLLLIVFHCRPVTGLWPYAWQPGEQDYQCLSWGLVYSVNSGISLACDVLMFIIPAIIIKQLHVSGVRKIQLSVVMFPGVFVIIISSIRVWLVVRGQWNSDGSWAYNPMLCVENAEIAGTLIALSVPALKPLFGNLFSHLTGYKSSYIQSQTHSRSMGALRSRSKPLGSNSVSCSRDDKELLSCSRPNYDDYEMMPPEISANEARVSVSQSPGIKVTSELNVSR